MAYDSASAMEYKADFCNVPFALCSLRFFGPAASLGRSPMRASCKGISCCIRQPSMSLTRYLPDGSILEGGVSEACPRSSQVCSA